jgi:hypothetical protein
MNLANFTKQSTIISKKLFGVKLFGKDFGFISTSALGGFCLWKPSRRGVAKKYKKGHSFMP